jgi:cytoskeletal protein CcmA (bactofilin family)
MRRRRKIRAEEITGFLDYGTTVTGELRFSGTLRIEGEFHGSITTEDMLTVGKDADVHADIHAGEVEVYGRVSGTITAKRRIEVYSTGKIKGDVRAPILVIEDGAALDGRSGMAAASEGATDTGTESETFEGVDEVN